jgi:hypothetical protein
MFSGSLNIKTWFLECHLSFEWTYTLLAQLDKFNLYTIFKSLFIMSVPGEYEHFSSKIGALYSTSKNKITIFLKMAWEILINFH